MLKHLKLKNFRRHADTDISFADDAQLTLISGKNGSGKSTILEAIRYALYGTPRTSTGRTGRTRLEDLVRRGAELEGLTVTLDFTVNGRDYTVTRRWDSGNSYAMLETGGNAITTGAKEVTQEISRLFGMDRVGFDLAVFASQQQLDGLAALSAADRANTVSRLLRLDAITKARDEARGKMADQKRLLVAMGSTPAVAELSATVTATTEELAELTAARDETNQAIKKLTADLSGHADVQAAYQEANQQKARAEGQLHSANTEKQSAEQSLRSLRDSATDKPTTAGEDLDALLAESDILGEKLDKERELSRQFRDRELLDAEITALRKKRDTLSRELSSLGGILGASTEEAAAEAALAEAKTTVEAIREKGQQARTALGVCEAELENLGRKKEAADQLGGVCDHCGQSISDDHRETHAQELRAAIEENTAKRADLQATIETLMGEYNSAAGEVRTQEESLTAARRNVDRARSLGAEVSDLDRKVELHTRRVAALPDKAGDEAAVASERARVAEKIRAVRAAEQQLRDWEKHQANITSAELRVANAERTVRDATARVEEAAIPETLLQSVDRLGALAQELAAEKEVAAECSTAVAVAEQELISAKEKLETAEKAAAKRDEVVEGVEVHEAAARLLTAVSETESASVRPALEGAVSSVLALMSEGRFDAVRINSDYSMMVRDDGQLRPLAELSGGEQNLAALALRLGLATVVSARHGATSPGFLVLDEVFGSQDVGRREAILTGLRSLKATWPQILLVSHIEGTEDTVDAVLQVERVEAPEEDADYEVAEAVVTEG